jgi:hypothetical protein
LPSTVPESPAADAAEAPARTHWVRRELLIVVVAALVGFIVAPLAIYAVGHAFLGAYNRGGAGQLLADFMNGLAHGSPVFWAVAVGPYVMTLLARLLYEQARGR